MAKIEDCPGFETFGADVKEARKAKHLTRKDLAEKVNIESRYLANIENEGTIPSLPVVIQLIKIERIVKIRFMLAHFFFFSFQTWNNSKTVANTIPLTR